MRIAMTIFILLSLVGPAAAQTLAQPIQGAYDEIYMIAGRIIDSRGLPMRGGLITVEIEGKTMPSEGLLNCKGDFVTWFDLVDVSISDKVKISILDENRKVMSSHSAPVDPFYRRTDVQLTLNKPWLNACKDEVDVWSVSASLKVRILNRTAEAYDHNGTKMYGTPYPGIIRLRYETPDGNTVCPPHPQDQTPGACELFLADARGDIKYTFTLDQPFVAGGRIEILGQWDNMTLSVPIDPANRLGVANFEATGQGPPQGVYKADTPGFGVAGLVLSLVAAIVLVRRR